MKKIVSILLAALLLVLSACGGPIRQDRGREAAKSDFETARKALRNAEEDWDELLEKARGLLEDTAEANPAREELLNELADFLDEHADVSIELPDMAGKTEEIERQIKELEQQTQEFSDRYDELSGLIKALRRSDRNQSVTAQTAGSASGAYTGVFKLGFLGPLSGGAGIYGTSAMRGAEIAVEEINSQGILELQLSVTDDQHDAGLSVNGYNALKAWGMQALIGPITSACAIPVSNEAWADGVFLLTPTASSLNVIGGQTGGEPRKSNVFQMCFTDPNQGAASARYIAAHDPSAKIAVIYDSSDSSYSTAVYEKFAAEAGALGLEIVSVSFFDGYSTVDFSVQLAAAQGMGADLVFLPVYYNAASLILTQAHALNYAPTFFGIDGMDGILSMDGFDPALAEGLVILGVFDPNAPDVETARFVDSYQARYGELPNYFAAVAYDSVRAVCEALLLSGATAEMTPSEICERLTDVFNGGFVFNGVTGRNATWSNSGEVTKEPCVVIVRDGAYLSL